MLLVACAAAAAAAASRLLSSSLLLLYDIVGLGLTCGKKKEPRVEIFLF